MTDRRKQVRVGVFALVTAALVALALVAFAGLNFWKHHDHYYVVFDDSVLGLSPGAPVTLNGIKVGNVDGVELSPDDLGKVRVGVELDANTPVHTDTHAFLSMAGITGVRSIDLKGGSYAAPRLAQRGVIVAGLGTLDKLQAKAEMLADESAKLMRRANEIVDGANRVMANLSAVTDPVALQAIVESTRRATANLAEASRGVVGMVGETRVALARSLESVRGTGTTAQSVLESVRSAAASAQGVLDKQVAGLVDNANALVGDLRGVIHGNEAVLQAATADMRQATRSLKELAREVRERPSSLLFSGTLADRRLP